jgi:hypothetical protein
MAITRALTNGLIGACALILIHETARRLRPDAPRMDVLGMRAIEGIYQRLGLDPPGEGDLFPKAMIGDLVGNTLYYSLVRDTRKGARERGLLLGGAAELGAILLPPIQGRDAWPIRRTPQTAAMTLAFYTLGGLAAAAACQWNDSTAPEGENV